MVRIMAPHTKWTQSLRCPICRIRGEARVSGRVNLGAGADGATAVLFLPGGFKEVESKRAIGAVEIHCAQCDVSALSDAK
jgi:hypothetical protein